MNILQKHIIAGFWEILNEKFTVCSKNDYLIISCDLVDSYGSTNLTLRFHEEKQWVDLRHDGFLIDESFIYNDASAGEQHFINLLNTYKDVFEHVKSR